MNQREISSWVYQTINLRADYEFYMKILSTINQDLGGNHLKELLKETTKELRRTEFDWVAAIMIFKSPEIRRLPNLGLERTIRECDKMIKWWLPQEIPQDLHDYIITFI